MVVEQRGTTDGDDIHNHCLGCVKVWKCSTRPQKERGCNIVWCDAECGARFHVCKLREHLLLCPNVKVPCINSVNGCSAWLLRGEMGTHLRRCPASVVHCTMEWNRWPTQEGAPPPCGTPTQLDVALALRDQRALGSRPNARMGSSTSVQKPAAPTFGYGFQRSDETNQNCDLMMQVLSHDGCDAPWETKKVPPGLQRSVCSELYRASRQATESLTAALTVITGHAAARNVCCSVNGASSAPSDAPVVLNGILHHGSPKADGVTRANRDGLNGSINLNGVIASESRSQCNKDLKAKNGDATHETSGGCSSSPLVLDLNLECITRYQPKPKSMYTFLCDQDFRRDEYAWHYQNVHGDIHGGLNGWLEQRCPLAQYGCTFSRRRLFPSPAGSALVHNDILESFGLRFPLPACAEHEPDPDVTNVCADRSLRMPAKILGQQNGVSKDLAKALSARVSFSSLPFEVLQHIARFLDSFSLCNFALVSRITRDVCRSLLEARGMVILQWEKRDGHWRVSHKRWCFSTAFSPIHEWCFSEDSNMSNHLMRCPFFLRNVKSAPFFGLAATARPFDVILKETAGMPCDLLLEARWLAVLGKHDGEQQMTKL